MTVIRFDIYRHTFNAPHMPATFFCAPPELALTHPSIGTTPALEPATTQHQAAYTGRVCWQLPADLLLLNGVGLQHCISKFQKDYEQLPYLNNVRILFLACPLGGSCILDYRIPETRGLWRPPLAISGRTSTRSHLPTLSMPGMPPPAGRP